MFQSTRKAFNRVLKEEVNPEHPGDLRMQIQVLIFTASLTVKSGLARVRIMHGMLIHGGRYFQVEGLQYHLHYFGDLGAHIFKACLCFIL